MQSFDFSLLILPTLWIFFITLCIAIYVTRSVIFSISAAFVKAGIFLIYFGQLFDGTFTFLDDWGYVNGGIALVDEGVGLFNLAEKWKFALMIGGGDHFIYYLYNAYAFRFFSVDYFAPVALNIMLTVLIAWSGSTLGAREFGFKDKWKSIFFFFLLFHPDILAWSTVMNGKDILVLLAHVLLLLSASFYFEGRKWTAISMAVPIVLILFFLRFYVPVFFAGALIVQQTLIIKNGRNMFWLFVFASLLVFVTVSMIGHLIPQALSMLQEHSINPLFGFVHMALTPIPFNTDINYSFLNIPALLHWIMIPMVCYGLILLKRDYKSNFNRFFIIYLILFMVLYSINGELTGPRHRVQLDFAWAVLQFMGIKHILIWMFANLKTPKPMPDRLSEAG
jgi:hypothetical protein